MSYTCRYRDDHMVGFPSGDSPGDAAMRYHCMNPRGQVFPMGSGTECIFNVVEVEGHGEWIVRAFKKGGKIRPGGAKPVEITLDSLAEKLGLQRGELEIGSGWYLEEY